jgi:hypothetical protein
MTGNIIFSKCVHEDWDKALDPIWQEKESRLDALIIHQNSLLKEVTTLSTLGNILFKIVLKITHAMRSNQELPEGESFKR